MSKELYEEALADVKKIQEVAEDNAKRAVLEAVVPRIRELIERELLQEDLGDSDDMSVAPPAIGAPVEPVVATTTVPVDPSPASALTMPDAEGKVTLDLDALACQPAGEPVSPPAFGPVAPVEEYELSLESFDALVPVVKSRAGFNAKLVRLGEMIKKLKSGKQLSEQASYSEQITKMISHVEDMYGYVQESMSDPATKSSYETKLETYFKELNKLQEPTMSNKKNQKMNESDVTLKLTGMPDDLDLDSVGVDLVAGEDEIDGDVETGADDLGDLELGGEEDADAGQEMDMGEALQLSDDTVVEIDENMLRREIARMKSLREEAAPSADGKGVDAKSMDDFGGGSDDGDALLDHEPTTDGAEPLGESDEMDEADQVAEGDDEELDEMGFGTTGWGGGRGRRKEETNEADAECATESRRLAFEKRLQERAKARAASLKKEASACKDAKKVASLKKEYNAVVKRFNESVARSAKLVKESRSNNVSKRSADPTVQQLRAKLAETNLFNAKLAYTNKLLQNEQLNPRQKARVIEQLDSAKTVREAKLVYESVAQTMATTSQSIVENKARRVIGSASRSTRPASAVLTESNGYDRWAQLAGIKK